MSIVTDQKIDLLAEVAKGTPAVAGAATAALTLNEMVAVATGIYIIVQVAYLIRKWFCEERERKERRAAEAAMFAKNMAAA